jgi:predicted RNA-binding protein
MRPNKTSKIYIIFFLITFLILFNQKITFTQQKIGDLSLTVKIIQTLIEGTNEELIKNPLNEEFFIKKRVLESEMRDIIAENDLATLALTQMRRIDNEKALYRELINDFRENKLACQKLLELVNFINARNEEYIRLISKNNPKRRNKK